MEIRQTSNRNFPHEVFSEIWSQNFMKNKVEVFRIYWYLVYKLLVGSRTLSKINKRDDTNIYYVLLHHICHHGHLKLRIQTYQEENKETSRVVPAQLTAIFSSTHLWKDEYSARSSTYSWVLSWRIFWSYKFKDIQH